jgi:hypothetical protein
LAVRYLSSRELVRDVLAANLLPLVKILPNAYYNQ